MTKVEAARRAAWLAESPIFTADKVLELLSKARIRVQLSPEAAARLARTLEHYREFYRIDRSLDPVNAAKRKALKTADKLIEALSEIEGEEQKFLVAAERGLAAMPEWALGPTIVRVKQDQLAEIEQLKGLVRHIKGSEALEEMRNGAQRWIQYAPDILGALYAAIGEHGISERGPAARFFEAIVPFLTDEKTTAGSAATQLKKRLGEL